VGRLAFVSALWVVVQKCLVGRWGGTSDDFDVQTVVFPHVYMYCYMSMCVRIIRG